MAKTTPLDPAVPAGSEDPKLGDNRIRNLAAAVAELLSKDHYMGTDGGAGTGYNEDAAGEHAKVTIRNGSAPTTAAGKGFLYVASGELYYKDASGNVIQLTNGGKLYGLDLTNAQTAAGVKTFSAQASFAAGITAAAAIISTLAQGTAPLQVASNTKVTNLNADKWDGYDLAAYAGGESFTIGTFIIKMGYKARSGTSTTVTFAEAFTNNIVSVVVTPRWTSTGDFSVNVSAQSKTAFTVITDQAQVTGYNWIAIGY